MWFGQIFVPLISIFTGLTAQLFPACVNARTLASCIIEILLRLKKINLINSSTIFFSTLIVAFIISLCVYLTGLHNHRSLYSNSLITTTILTTVLFCFIAVGLYNGWKLKDTLGNFRNYFNKLKKPKDPNYDLSKFDGLEVLEVAEGFDGCLLTIFVWVVVGIFGSLILWSIGAFFWGIILFLAGLFYWIIFRAFRLIFKNSAHCKGNIFKSLQISTLYTVLYVGWIYVVIYIGHYFMQ